MIARAAVAGAFVLVWGVLPVVAQQPRDDRWFVSTEGSEWRVRTPAAPGKVSRERSLRKYDVIHAQELLRCDGPPCLLTYYSTAPVVVAVSAPAGAAAPASRPVFATPVKPRNWVKIGAPPADNLGGSVQGPRDLREFISTVGVRGGRAKDSPTCSGDLALIAPVCGETLDVTGVTFQWQPRPEDAGKVFTLIVGGADSSERRRWNSIPVDAATFGDRTLGEYLARLQHPNLAVDVTLTLRRTARFEAVRLVRLPSRAESEGLAARTAALAAQPALPRQIGLLGEYLKMSMWSKAADVATQMLQDAPDSLEVQQYALVGLCRSGKASEVVRLRRLVEDAGVTGLCNPEE